MYLKSCVSTPLSSARETKTVLTFFSCVCGQFIKVSLGIVFYSLYTMKLIIAKDVSASPESEMVQFLYFNREGSAKLEHCKYYKADQSDGAMK